MTQPDRVQIEPAGNSNSFKPRNPEFDFHGEQRGNQTHASRTDLEARLYRKGPDKPSRLARFGYVLSENRNGLIVETRVIEANGTAERDAAVQMIQDYRKKHGRGLGPLVPMRATTPTNSYFAWNKRELFRMSR